MLSRIRMVHILSFEVAGVTPIAEVVCDTCTFQNITSLTTENPLIWTLAQIQFTNTQFLDIHAESRFIWAAHSEDLTMAPRSIVIEECSFNNIYAVLPFIYFWPSNNDVQISTLFALRQIHR
eukprot:942485_1